MTKVTDAYLSQKRPVVLCDFSPPRNADPEFVDRVADVPADFISVAYNPGRLARADSSSVAHVIQQRLGREAVFTLSPRDMNKIALQSQLLGASMIGLQNVILLGGDNLTERETLQGVRQVRDLTPTALISAVRAMNAGADYRGAPLQGTTDFCIGAAIDLEKDFEHEARLAGYKVRAGADFLLTQPIYSIEDRARFLELYEMNADGPLRLPVFWGIQILSGNGLTFGNVPKKVRVDLERGRSGTDVATDMLAAFYAAGVRGVYLVPPIMKGGSRDYDAAALVLRNLGY